MLKKRAIRKILITTITIVILLMIYIMPSNKTNSKSLKVEKSIEYSNVNTSNIYLLNDNDLLVKVNSIISETSDIETKINDIINNLLNETTVPNKLKKVIPKNTKLLQMTYENNELSLNFSKELLNVEEKYQRKLVESICYSIFEIDEVKNIRIYAEDKNINEYFNSIDEAITREFGINKKYNINSFKDIQKIVVYYVMNIDDNKYYVPITNYVNDNKDKIKVIIESLTSNYIYEPNLISYLNSKTELINYEINNDVMLLNFNNSIFASDSRILEEVIYTLSYSIFDNYKVEKLAINVENKNIEKVLKKNIE